MNSIQLRMNALMGLQIPSVTKVDERTASMRINSDWDVKITILEKSIIYEARSKGKSFDLKKDIGIPEDVKGVIEALEEKFSAALLDLLDEAEKDPIENLKEAGFELGPEPVPVESFEEPEQPKKEEWIIGGKPSNARKVNEDLESVNLPAPVGVGGIVRPAVTAREALAAWREFQELKKYIIEKSDIQVIQNKPHIKKSGWRKFATFYNLTDKIVEETKEELANGAFQWKMKVICTAPNGRQTEGVAICTSTEKKFAHVEHDVYTTCHTRAKNRAISDMIAAGEVSAEEMEA